MHGHDCTGGCGTAMAYPGDRCSGCKTWLDDQHDLWANAAENCINLGITIAREIRRDA